MSHLEFKGLLVKLPAAVTLVLPGGNETEMFVVAFGFTVLRLHFFPEMAAAAFPPIERVFTHQFTQLDEIGYPSSLIQLGVELADLAGNAQIAPELSLEGPDLRDGFL